MDVEKSQFIRKQLELKNKILSYKKLLNEILSN